MSKVALEKMVGTQGKADYAKVAVADCLAVGIKPLMSVAGSKEIDGVTRLLLVSAVRVRAMAKDEQTVADVGKCVGKLIPVLGWSKKDDRRASCILAESQNTTEDWNSREEFIERLATEDFALPAWMALVKTIQDVGAPTASLEDVEAFFKEFIEERVEHFFVMAKQGGVKIVPDRSPVTGGEDVVINLAEKKAAKKKAAAKQVPTTKKKKKTLTLTKLGGGVAGKVTVESTGKADIDKSVVVKKKVAKKKVAKKVAKKKVPLKKGDE